ncbi:hypothetical protein [Streptomyces sp. ME18-1-4]|uniref:hypothetical protein n=1 Tax=Streptomyces sp. ME18-1-4 TaxID=3028685 RepID=UPI0029BEDD00|nr:hypothetical protein [Streptomyces sp. ME18-1-4]MDX3247311.1 hypothetical protein [Streptomyces sp. ME18-1-4]
MSERPSGPEGTSPASFSSSPSDSGRAYQARGDQTINEYHYHGSAPPVQPSTTAPDRRKPVVSALTGSLAAMAVVTLLLMGAGGTWLWLHSTSTADATSEAGGPHSAAPNTPVPPSASPSGSPSGSPPVSLSAVPSPTRSSTTVATSSSPSPKPEAVVDSTPTTAPNPAAERDCRAWFDTGVGSVQARACSRLDGDRAYMIAEWRTTSGTASADVYLWLEDSAERVVFPNATYAKKSPSVAAFPAGSPHQQWVEWEIRADLVHGTRYEICLGVQPEGSGNGPTIQSTNVDGHQVHLDY